MLKDDEHVTEDILRWLKKRSKFISEGSIDLTGFETHFSYGTSHPPLPHFPYLRPKKIPTYGITRTPRLPIHIINPSPAGASAPTPAPGGPIFWTSRGFVVGDTISAEYPGIATMENAILRSFTPHGISGEFVANVEFSDNTTGTYSRLDFLSGIIDPHIIMNAGVNMKQKPGPDTPVGDDDYDGDDDEDEQQYDGDDVDQKDSDELENQNQAVDGTLDPTHPANWVSDEIKHILNPFGVGKSGVKIDHKAKGSDVVNKDKFGDVSTIKTYDILPFLNEGLNANMYVYDTVDQKWVKGDVYTSSFNKTENSYRADIVRGDGSMDEITLEADEIFDKTDIEGLYPGTINTLNTRDQVNAYREHAIEYSKKNKDQYKWLILDGKKYKVANTLWDKFRLSDIKEGKLSYPSSDKEFIWRQDIDKNDNWNWMDHDPEEPTGQTLFGSVSKRPIQHLTSKGLFNYKQVELVKRVWDIEKEKYTYTDKGGVIYDQDQLDAMPSHYKIGAVMEIIEGFELGGKTDEWVANVQDFQWDEADRSWDYLMKKGRTEELVWTDDLHLSKYNFSTANAKDSLLKYLNENTAGYGGGELTNPPKVIKEWANDYYRSATTHDLVGMVEDDIHLSSIFDGSFSQYRTGDNILWKDSKGNRVISTVDRINYKDKTATIHVGGGDPDKTVDIKELNSKAKQFNLHGGLYIGQQVQGIHDDETGEYIEGTVERFTKDGVVINYPNETIPYTWEDVHKDRKVFGAIEIDDTMYIDKEYYTDNGRETIKITSIDNSRGIVYYKYKNHQGKWAEEPAEMTINQMFFQRGITDPETDQRLMPQYSGSPDKETMIYLMEHDYVNNGTSIRNFAMMYPQWEHIIKDAITQYKHEGLIQKMIEGDPSWESWIDRTAQEELDALYEQGGTKYIFVKGRSIDDPEKAPTWKKVEVIRTDPEKGYTYIDPFENITVTSMTGPLVSIRDRTNYEWTDDPEMSGMVTEDNWVYGNLDTPTDDPNEESFPGGSGSSYKHAQDRWNEATERYALAEGRFNLAASMGHVNDKQTAQADMARATAEIKKADNEMTNISDKQEAAWQIVHQGRVEKWNTAHAEHVLQEADVLGGNIEGHIKGVKYDRPEILSKVDGQIENLIGQGTFTTKISPGELSRRRNEYMKEHPSTTPTQEDVDLDAHAYIAPADKGGTL